MPRFAALYNAFLWSMALCILLFQNLWLEMRVNLGVAFFALWALLFLLMAGTRPLRRVFGSLAGATFSWERNASFPCPPPSSARG